MARHYNSSYYEYLQYLSLPIHFFFFIAIVVIFLILTWYVSYEPLLEDLMDNFKLGLMVIPVILLLFVHWLSAEDHQRVPFCLSFPEKESFHRVGGSTVGVAVVLVVLMFMISHHGSLQERWFPLFSRR